MLSYFDLGPHAAFIWLCYGVVAAAMSALVLWVWLDERSQRNRLADLERRGLRRRSATGDGH